MDCAGLPEGAHGPASGAQGVRGRAAPVALLPIRQRKWVQRMKKRRRLLLLFSAALLAGVCLAVALNRRWHLPPAAADVTIEVTGSPGAPVEVIFEIDGRSMPAGTECLPATFHFPRARVVEYSIRRG